jgi:hypothetical protein
VKKAFCKKLHKHNKSHTNDSESDSKSDCLWSGRSDSMGKLHMCKKRKLNVSVNNYT